MFGGREGLTAQGIRIASLVPRLSLQLGRTVINKTGLAGKDDFTMKRAPNEIKSAMFKGPESGQPSPASVAFPDSSGPSLFTAQEQLGLKLESQKGPVEIYVIGHAEKLRRINKLRGYETHGRTETFRNARSGFCLGFGKWTLPDQHGYGAATRV